MAVNFTLSSEQAALLLPILQQITSKQSGTPATIVTPDRRYPESFSNPTSGSRSSPGNVESFTSELDFSREELLSKKQKNKKSTSAQSYLLVSEP